MKKALFLLAICLSYSSVAQKLISTKSKTTFFSSATLEDITATTTQGRSVIDVLTGEIAFSIPIGSFQFAKSLMQEHFNEKYMETEKFPKATFAGKIENWKGQVSIDSATAKGALSIHGVTQHIKTTGSVILKNNKLIIKARFEVRLEDFGVEVPSIMFQKIAEVVEVNVHYEYNLDEK